ncbi:hypothetical protein Kisp02_54930 [Kineosporia sp. NBRC 101731]|nr:hypothetical protein Kisp02_54930 [Kineosporia sp. NBRC 101731]
MTAAGKLRAVPDPYAYQEGTAIPGKDWCGSAPTDALGQVTFTLPSGYFSAVHHVSATPVRSASGPSQFCWAFPLSMSATQVKVQVAESKTTGVLLLNTTVEGAEASPAGVTVTVWVRGVG